MRTKRALHVFLAGFDVDSLAGFIAASLGTVRLTVVPEPSAIFVLSIAVFGLAARRRR